MARNAAIAGCGSWRSLRRPGAPPRAGLTALDSGNVDCTQGGDACAATDSRAVTAVAVSRNAGGFGGHSQGLVRMLSPFHIFVRLASIAFAAVCCLSQVHAQGAVRSVHGDWQIRCDTPPGAQQEQCALIQSVVAEDRSNAGLTVIVLKTADQKSKLMRVVAPLGVLLPSGLGLKLDNADIGRAGFVRCLPNGCVAEVVLDDKLLGQIRSAKTATFIIFETPEEGIGFPLSLNGLGEGYDKLP
jgi:invasion protein IalB